MVTPLDASTRQAIRDAFKTGTLKVKAVNPQTSEVGLHPLTAVLRHETGHKRAFEVTTRFNQTVVATEDHSLFRYEYNNHQPYIHDVQTGALAPGTLLAVILPALGLQGIPIRSVQEVEPRRFMYDLSVPGPQNFVLSNGILAHNSYSIGGISLDIERSSKYQSLMSEAASQFQQAAQEGKRNTVKHIRGLQQPRFGMGIRSAFGPGVGRGVLSPRSFL